MIKSLSKIPKSAYKNYGSITSNPNPASRPRAQHSAEIVTSNFNVHASERGEGGLNSVPKTSQVGGEGQFHLG